MTRRASIPSKLLFSLALTAGLFCVAPGASAQTIVSVDIPFAFSADNQNLAAGHYQVQQASDRFLYIRNVQSGNAAFLMVRPEGDGMPKNGGRLVFNRTGNRSDLMQVWIPGTSGHSELVVQPRYQNELAKRSARVSTIELAAK